VAPSPNGTSNDEDNEDNDEHVSEPDGVSVSESESFDFGPLDVDEMYDCDCGVTEFDDCGTREGGSR